MKELDVFFEAFVANGLAAVPEDELPDLARLLDLPDQDILAALVTDEPGSPGLLDDGMWRMAGRIRASLASELPR